MANFETYDVTDCLGVQHTIVTEFMFNNEGTLVFRSGERGNTTVDATFGPEKWVSCVRRRPVARNQGARADG